jgi:hypothetical protein
VRQSVGANQHSDDQPGFTHQEPAPCAAGRSAPNRCNQPWRRLTSAAMPPSPRQKGQGQFILPTDTSPMSRASRIAPLWPRLVTRRHHIGRSNFFASVPRAS